MSESEDPPTPPFSPPTDPLPESVQVPWGRMRAGPTAQASTPRLWYRDMSGATGSLNRL